MKEIKIEQYQNEDNRNNDGEVLIMNYDDGVSEDYTGIPYIRQTESEDKSYDIKIKYNEQETIANREVKVEDEELCDLDMKKNILIKFEQENVDKTEKEEDEQIKISNSAKNKKKKKICRQCGFRAAKKHHLQSHIKLAHREKKEVPTDFECKYCMFKTKYKHSMGFHMANFHMDEIQGGSASSRPKKSCYEVQKTNVLDHSTLDDDNVYNCNYCSYKSPNKVVFLKHTVVHLVHKSEVLQCPKCPKKFTKSVLQVHLNQVHNPEGVFSCPKCSYSTPWRNNLRRHVKQNKDNETCKPICKRKTAQQMAQERKAGKAPPLMSRRKNDSDSE